MKILSNKKYSELILKSCRGMFGAVTDDMLLRENALLNEENQQLKERVKYLERSNNRREDTIIGYRLEDIGIVAELEEWLKENIKSKPLQTTYFFEIDHKQKSISEIELNELKRVLHKIQELKEKYK